MFWGTKPIQISKAHSYNVYFLTKLSNTWHMKINNLDETLYF